MMESSSKDARFKKNADEYTAKELNSMTEKTAVSTTREGERHEINSIPESSFPSRNSS